MLKGLEFDVAIHRNLHLAAFFKVGFYERIDLSSDHQVITEFCCNKMHKEADMAIVVILRCGIHYYMKLFCRGVYSSQKLIFL